MTGMDVMPLTQREREVLDALLAIASPDVERLRAQADDVVVVDACGYPSSTSSTIVVRE